MSIVRRRRPSAEGATPWRGWPGQGRVRRAADGGELRVDHHAWISGATGPDTVAGDPQTLRAAYLPRPTCLGAAPLIEPANRFEMVEPGKARTVKPPDGRRAILRQPSQSTGQDHRAHPLVRHAARTPGTGAATLATWCTNSSRPIQIAPQGLRDYRIQVDAMVLGKQRRTPVQVSSRADVESTFQWCIRHTFLGFAECNIIVDGLLKRGLQALGIRSFVGHQISNELKAPVQHFVILAVVDRPKISFVFQHFAFPLNFSIFVIAVLPWSAPPSHIPRHIV